MASHSVVLLLLAGAVFVNAALAPAPASAPVPLTASVPQPSGTPAGMPNTRRRLQGFFCLLQTGPCCFAANLLVSCPL